MLQAPEDRALTRSLRYLLAAISAALLLMMLTYPLGYDQSTFIVGGDMIRSHGAVPYRDFQDVKPPLIFYIYAAALWIFGHHVWSIRALDVIYTGFTCYYFYRLVRRESGSESLALLSMFLLVVRTVGVGYGESAQTESFAVLPMLGLMDATLGLKRDRSNLILAAIAASIATIALFLLKFTFVIATIGAFVFLLFERDLSFKRRLGYVLLTSVMSLALLGLFLWQLALTGAYPYFIEALEWAAKYSNVDPLLAQQTITKLYYVDFPAKFIHTFTLTGFVTGLLGVATFLRRLITREPGPAALAKYNRLYGYLILQTLVGLAAVFIERKFFPYHFTRAYWAFTPFIALGILKLSEWAPVAWRVLRSLPRLERAGVFLVGGVLSLFLLFYSPIMQLVSQPFYYTAVKLAGKSAAESVERREEGFPYSQMEQLGARLDSLMRPNDQLFYWGMDATLYFFANRTPVTNEVITTPYTAPWVSQRWKDDVVAKLRAAAPTYTVIEHGDRTFLVTRTEKDSYQHLMDWPALRDYIATNYHPYFNFGNFSVYLRNDYRR